MTNHLSKFRELLLELHHNESVVVLEYQEFSGIDPTSYDIQEIEEIIGFKIPKEVLDFYAESDGLRLSWIHKEDDFYDAELHRPLQLPANLDELPKGAYPNDVESKHESGSINIRCIYDVFMSEFEYNTYLRGEGYYVFDAFSAIHGAALSFPQSKQEPVISFNNDYYTHFDDYDGAMNFTAYLNYLIQCKGVKTLRKNQDKLSLLPKDLQNWPEEFYYCEY